MNSKICNLAQIASVRRYTYTDGREKGLSVIDCDNGKIRFTLNASKALDMMQLFYKGENLSYLSKNAFTAREIDFMNRFEGGMLYTCGLDSVGGREGFEVHGSLHNMTAEVTRAECTEEGIVVEATIRSTELFGKNLILKRRVTSALLSGSVTVSDTLINEGYKEENYCLLYHANLGYPLLDEGARIEGEILKIDPRTDFAHERIDGALEMGESVDNEDETCYFLTLDTPRISLVNEKKGKKFTLDYSKDTLPSFVEWKSMASGDYVLGLEPATTELDERFSYQKIEKGGKREFFVTFTVEEL